jgi:hypothetical protein
MRGERSIVLPLACLTLALFVGTAPARGAESMPTSLPTAPPVRLAVQLTPERLGAGTTIVFELHVSNQRGTAPRPVSAIDLLFPVNLGLINSGLGLATCAEGTLEASGPEGCPRDALMGHGRALVEFPVGPEIIDETGYITTWLAPVQAGHLAMLFYAEGRSPVSAQLIFTSLLLEAAAPYGGSLNTTIPPIPTLPDAPYAAIVQMHATIGSQGITYYTHAHGRKVPYRPDGLRLPHICPHDGFPFAAVVSFSDGSRADAHSRVPCPRG